VSGAASERELKIWDNYQTRAQGHLSGKLAGGFAEMLGLKIAILSAYAGAGAYVGYYVGKSLIEFCETAIGAAVLAYRRKMAER
jgi:hypothetical protein